MVWTDSDINVDNINVFQGMPERLWSESLIHENTDFAIRMMSESEWNSIYRGCFIREAWKHQLCISLLRKRAYILKIGL